MYPTSRPLPDNARMYSAKNPDFASNVLKDMPRKRVYQVWKGSNRFFLGGRLIFGPDVRSLLVTIVLIIAPVVVFCTFVAKPLMHEFAHHAGVAIMVVTAVFTTWVLLLLLLTSGRDPGIIPRNMHPPEPDDEDTANSPGDWRGQTPKFKLPRTKDVVVNGIEVKIKYCDTCMLYRPPRCSHCSICNNCVERFDHHCPWVGQCIGRRNYPFFFFFVSCTTLLCIYIFSMSAMHIQKSMEKNSYTVWRALGKAPAAVFLMVYTFISVWFVGGLTIFHLYLISTNQTTYENFRYRYDNRVNPYNQGIAHNFAELFCTAIPASKNDFRASVKQEPFVPISNVQNSGTDIQGPNDRKNLGDIQMRANAEWASLFAEVGSAQEPYGRNSGASGVDSEIKEGYEDAFVRALGHPLPHDSADIRVGVHPRRSSWGRKSRSWEHVPDILALAAGVGSEGSRPNGSSSPPRNR